MRAAPMTPRWHSRRFWLAILVVLGLAAPPVAAGAPGCPAYFATAEAERGLPSGLLAAVAAVESDGWPWIIDRHGESHRYATQVEAVEALRMLLAQGERSIDVGCMQVNLFWHPNAFASPEQAFDPEANVAYAARFLRQLFDQSGNWASAVARYHSGDAALGEAYRRLVMARWQGATTSERAVARDSEWAVVSVQTLADGAELQRLRQRQTVVLAALAAAGRSRRLARIVVLGDAASGIN